jgi:glycosyltransferase involved in cell wall biosynthesis
LAEVVLAGRWIPDDHHTVLLSPSAAATAGVRLPQIVVVQSSLMLPSVRAQLRGSEIPASILKRAGHTLLLRWSLRRARVVVAVSRFVAREITASYPFAAPKLEVVYEGVDRGLFSRPKPGAEGAKREPPYFLTVGTLYRYKNTDKAIEALACLRDAADVPRDLGLKIVGRDPDGKQKERLEAIAGRFEVTSRVEMLGPVEHSSMSRLYREATGLIYPSRVESFGLPLLEAMSAGTPVVCSSRGALPEIAGDAGLVVDCDNVEVIAQALRRLVTDQALRSEKVAAGLRRAGEFTWQRTASGMLRIMRRLSHDLEV